MDMRGQEWCAVPSGTAYRAVPRLKPLARYLRIASIIAIAGRKARVPAAFRSSHPTDLIGPAVSPIPLHTPTETVFVAAPVSEPT